MSAKKRGLGSNFEKIDLHDITEAEYAELPEATDADFARATVHHAGKPARGRPPIGSGTKQLMSLRLDPEIRERFRSSGPGWQSRMNIFLLHNEVVLKLIVDFDDAIGDMETLIEQLRSGGIKPVTESVETAIQRVERNISLNGETTRALRKTLVWAPTEPVA